MKKISSVLFAQLIAFTAFCQDVEMADGLRSDGKIYVLVSILLVIFIGLIAYLISIDRKTSRLEKKLGENKPS